MKKTVSYFEKHSHRMNYAIPDEMKLPAGSGQVESAVRRLVDLRFKAPGTFWKEETVGGLMHLRAFFGRVRNLEICPYLSYKFRWLPAQYPVVVHYRIFQIRTMGGTDDPSINRKVSYACFQIREGK